MDLRTRGALLTPESLPVLLNRPRITHCNVPWYFYLEGIGNAHLGDPDDADQAALECIKALEGARQRITTAKFETCTTPEANLLEPSVRDFYEHLAKRAREK